PSAHGLHSWCCTSKWASRDEPISWAASSSSFSSISFCSAIPVSSVWCLVTSSVSLPTLVCRVATLVPKIGGGAACHTALCSGLLRVSSTVRCIASRLRYWSFIFGARNLPDVLSALQVPISEWLPLISKL